MFKVGERVRWMEPLDPEYSYGKILSIEHNLATLEEMGYYAGKVVTKHLRYIKHLERGSRGESTKHSK